MKQLVVLMALVAVAAANQGPAEVQVDEQVAPVAPVAPEQPSFLMQPQQPGLANGQQAQQQFPKQDFKNGLKRFGGHFKDLADGWKKGFKVAYEESKPTLATMRTDAVNGINQIRSDPRVQKFEKKVAPMINAGNQKINGVINNLKNKHHGHQQQPLEAVPTPVVPQGAQ